ncbi:MAG TPA: CinA family protein, partial [Xanthobacteraceae bacterium]|nr:CinA family protein [Xanthobacteraceae bacterium]
MLSVRVGTALLERRIRLVLAESCTGGYVAKLITDVPGSSAWFDSGYVTYSNSAKQHVLGV